MRLIITGVLFLLIAAPLYAGTKIEVTEVSADALATVQEYFPGATVVAAEMEKDDEKIEYELKLEYKDIRLEVEITEDGKILDVEMKK